MSRSRGFVCLFKLHRDALFARRILGLLLTLPVCAWAAGPHGLPSAEWISPRALSSDDGRAELHWKVEGEAADPARQRLFRLIERRSREELSSFVDSDRLQILRVEPGNYEFRVEVCEKPVDGAIRCGKASKKLKLTVSDAVHDHALAASLPLSAIKKLAFDSVRGGPDQLRPGLWYNPERNGHGWSFYWANRLALPESHSQHGYAYDLLAVWYTYEAKSLEVEDSSTCGWNNSWADCEWVYGNYEPLAAQLKLVRSGPDSYSGGVYVTRNGVETHAGSATVSFASDNVNATVEWAADFKLQRLAGTDPITLLAGSIAEQDRNITHYAGTWELQGQPDKLVVNDVGSLSEGVEVVFANSAGDPTWIEASIEAIPTAAATPLCFYWVSNGSAPGSSGGALQYFSPGCDLTRAADSVNRNGGREFAALEQQHFWVSFSLPASSSGGGVTIGSPSVPARLDKTSSFHRIWFTNLSSSCEITASAPSCPVELNWFTDGDYPRASAFVVNQDSGQRRRLAVSTEPAVTGFTAVLDEPGSHRFELRMADTAESTLIARSASFVVSQVAIPATGELAAQWLDEAARHFQLHWTHPAPDQIDRYELEERLPATSASVLHALPVSQGTSKEFIHADGPYGDYSYRIRACGSVDGANACSDWSAVLNWTVSDPGGAGADLLYPWSAQSDTAGSLITDISFQYAMGYHFRVAGSGFVKELGGLFNGAKTVKLFERYTGVELAQATVYSNNSWSFAPVSPVALTAGKEYTVAVYLQGSGGSYYSSPVFPLVHEALTILGSTYVSTSSDPQAIPSNLTQAAMYGQVDIGFEVSLAPPNQAPSIDTQLADRENDEGDSVSFPINASDPDGDSLLFDAQGLPDGLLIDPVTGLVEGRIAAGAAVSSPYDVRIRVSDPGGLGDEQGFTWLVNAQPEPNRPPTITRPADRTDAVGDWVSLSFVVSDPDGDAVSCSVQGLPDGLSVSGCTVSGTLSGPSGVYAVAVTASDGQAQSDTVQLDWNVREPTSTANPALPPPPAPKPDFSIDPVSVSAGFTAGAFTVDEMGAANFQLPILTAPGSGGFSPAVSLEYNSRLPNGIVGVGWQIGGLSAITRCAATHEQDGLQGSRGLSITASDRFCLDGQRLMVTAGVYGANGAEYRTEIDSFSRIVSHGVAGSGPLFFRVWHADGSVSEYGNTNDSRLETRLTERAGTVLSWARNRSRDSSGNYIDFIYHKSSGVGVEHSIQTIRYTGNIRAGTKPYAEIRFVYAGDRPDISESFVSGERFLRRRLLQRVDSLAKARASDTSFTPLRSYFLGYGQDGFGRKVVESIEECSDVQKRYCFAPLVFDWLKTEHSISGGGLAAGSLFNKNFRDLAIADVNGDGRQDLLIVAKKRKRYSFRIAFASADSGFSLDTQRYEVPVDGLNGLPVRMTALDLNADGFDDIVYPRESSGTVSWVARLSDETGFGSEQVVATACCGTDRPALLQVMDFNGDGLGDLLTNRVSPVDERKGELVVLLNGHQPGALARFETPRPLSIEFSRSLLASGPSSDGWVEQEGAFRIRVVNLDSLAGARPFDYNDDGKVDLVARISRRYVRCSGDCTSNQRLASDVEITQQFIFEGADVGSGNSPENKGDEYAVASFYILFESDGEGRYVQREVLATGAGADCSVAEFCEPWAHLPAARRVLPIDINVDGLADIVHMDGAQVWHYRLNNGRSLEAPVTVAKLSGSLEAAHGAFIDINGDTYPDFIYPEAVSSDSANWIVHLNDLGNGFAAAERSAIRHGNKDDGDASILLDFDGDGMLDNLFIDLAKSRVKRSTTRLYRGRNHITGRRQESSNVVSVIRSGSGALTRLHYRPLIDESVYTRFRNASQLDWGRGSAVFDLVMPVQVVSGVSVSAPTAADPLATSEVDYHYAGARLQAGGRGFLGFAEVVSWNRQSGIRNNTRYRQDFPFIGMPLDASRSLAAAADARRLLSDPAAATVQPPLELTESLSPPAAGDESVLLEYSATQWAGTETKVGAGSWWPALTKSLSQSYTLAANLQRKVLVTNSYASYGKLVKAVTANWSPDSDQPVYTQTTEQSWHAADLNRWILRKPALTRVSHARPGMQVITRETGFSQDAETGRTIREVVEPNRAQYRVTTDFVLDDFGNRTRTTVTAEDVAARNSSTVYDSLGRFPVRTLNHFGQATLTVEDWDAFGTALKTRNIDGVLSLAASGPMGRVFAQWTATGASVRTTLRLGAGKYCPGGTALHTITAPAGGAREISCQDILGREIRGATEGFDGRFVNIDRRYDSLGQAAQLSEPYYADEPRYWNRMSYDALGRLLRLDTAGGDSERRSYDEQAGGPCATGRPGAGSVINALGQQSMELRNVLDEKVAAYDNACGQVRYDYDAIGNLIRTTGADQVSISMGYDPAGRRLWIDDPDKGYWQYRWNALGEMLRQLDAKRQAWDFSYDALGRVVERRESSAVNSLLDQDIVVRHRELHSWQNATTSAVRGKGQLVSVIYQDAVSGNTVQRLDYGYDDFGRRTSSTDSRGALQFSEAASFDEYGRKFQSFDASGDYRGIQYAYNSYGYVYKLSESRDAVAGPVFQRVRAMDARGNATFVELGNGVELFTDYDPATGILEKQQAYDVNGLSLQDVDYLFDAVGNLLQRHDRSNGRDLLEEFSYDPLNRLSRVELTAPAAGVATPLETMALSYGSSGNISWKSDVGNYRYGEGTAGPHAVSSAGGVSYGYDANGNQVEGDGRSIEYSLFDKPLRIEKNGQSVEFGYGAGRQRIMRIDRSSAFGEKITHYAGSVEYLEEADRARFRRYLGGVAVADFFPATGASRSRYLVKDHLGSVHSMTTHSGKVEHATWMSFNAFGERRSVDWTGTLAYSASAALNDLTRRGFGGHEHVDGLSVLHMNGRIYDPKLGRFLQADPYVQDSGDSQSLNRYSYVLNNPLSFTDPSGYFLKRLIKRWGRLALAIGLSILLPGPQGFLALQFGVTNVYVQAAITGFVAGAISSGSLKGAVIGAVIAVAATGIVQAHSTSTPGSELASYEELAPQESTLEHLYGPNGPPEGFYRIEVGANGEFVTHTPISASGVRNGEVLFTNGIKNGFQQSVRNATTHLNQVNMLEGSYVLNFNPTQGFLPDLLEASADVIGAHTGWAHSSLARNLAQSLHEISLNGVQGVQLVGHSQGGAIVASALRYAQSAGLNLSSLAGGGVALHGAPVNAWLARSRIGGRAGVAIRSRAQFGDAVHVLGGLNVSNPLEVPIALLRFPTLFSRDPGLSPHTLPCAGGVGFVCGK